MTGSATINRFAAATVAEATRLRGDGGLLCLTRLGDDTEEQYWLDVGCACIAGISKGLARGIFVLTAGTSCVATVLSEGISWAAAEDVTWTSVTTVP